MIKVLAVKGKYENGKVILDEVLQIEMSEVVVVFPDNGFAKASDKLTSNRKRELFEEFSGSINRVIDLKEERLEALCEEKFCEMLNSL